jgi:hypothetical protein
MRLKRWNCPHRQLGRKPSQRSCRSVDRPLDRPSRQSKRVFFAMMVSAVMIAGLNILSESSRVSAQEAPTVQPDSPTSIQGAGRWKKFRQNSVVGEQPADALTEKQMETMRQLEALGYLSGVSAAPAISGVTRHLRHRTAPGLNFYVSGHAPEATLIDMEGAVLHRWSYEYRAAFPEGRPPKTHWRRAHMYENGDLLALWEGRGLIRLNKDSDLIWKYSQKPHHDIFVTENGKIYVLARKARVIPSIHETEPVLEDFIDLLDENGKLLKRLSILDCIQNSDYHESVVEILQEQVASRLSLKRKLPGDIFHTNTIEVFDGTQEGVSPVFRKGNLLISLRTPSIVAVIDPEKEKAVWVSTGIWRHQHDPFLLTNGRMLMFDNEGNQGSSRVIEFDPFSQQVFWKFEGNPPGRFHSKCCGAVQRLGNGNTLITETDNGRALEVAPDGTVVWEFVSPHRAGENNELIAALYDMVRVPEEWDCAWLEN